MSETVVVGQPNLTITFTTAADTVTSRLGSGIVAVMVRDASIEAVSVLSTKRYSEIPSTLSAANITYATRAYKGSTLGTPGKVLLVLLPVESTDDDGAATTEYFADALDALWHQEADYVVAPLDATETELAAVEAWIVAQRAKYRVFKGILPEIAADCEGIINVNMADTVTADGTLSSVDMCPWVASILAGLPTTASVTACALSDVISVPMIDDDEANAKVDAGELFLVHDGRSVRMSRGVNSLTTVPSEGNDSWRKIKIIYAKDLITYYFKTAMEDARGTMTNTYANKQILVGNAMIYFAALEAAGAINSGYSCSVDAEAQEAYLKEQGTDTSDMTDAEVLQASTGSWVFLTASANVLDAMEDFSIAVNLTSD